jgi:serine protease DegQ
MLKVIMPAIVNIAVQGVAPGQIVLPQDQMRQQPDPSFSPPPRKFQGIGSGVIVDPGHGIVVTNSHVVRNAELITITLNDGRRLKAKKIGEDPATDIAVLKIDQKNLPPAITFGDMSSVHIGDVVLAIGNPFGVGQTVTSGIVSALGRDHVGINTFENFIQTDAAINPGNSGGALIDTRGNLIGINTAIYSNNGGSMGIGFAIPANLAKQVMESILTNGSVTRGWIGVEPQNVSKELAQSIGLASNIAGVLIAGVLEGGPADRGGVKPGDILTSINNQPIKDVRQLLNQIAKQEPGNEVQAMIIRKGKELNLSIKIGKRPKPKLAR